MRALNTEIVNARRQAIYAAWRAEKGLEQQSAHASVASSADAALSNLEPSTHSDQAPRWSYTLLDFGHVCELRAVYISEPLRRSRKGKTTTERLAGSCYEDPAKLAWRIRRAKRLCKWRALSLGADALWTGTRRNKFDNVDDVQSTVAKWVRLVRKELSSEFAYVAVPEQHADGKWHVHIAIRGFWPIEKMRKLWYRALGGSGEEEGSDSPGSINVKFFDGARAAVGVAKYISKYMAKSFAVVGNAKKSYWCSKGLGPVHVQRGSHPVILNRDAVMELREFIEAYRPGEYEVFEWNFAGTSGFIIKTRGS